MKRSIDLVQTCMNWNDDEIWMISWVYIWGEAKAYWELQFAEGVWAFRSRGHGVWSVRSSNIYCLTVESSSFPSLRTNPQRRISIECENLVTCFHGTRSHLDRRGKYFIDAYVPWKWCTIWCRWNIQSYRWFRFVDSFVSCRFTNYFCICSLYFIIRLRVHDEALRHW